MHPLTARTLRHAHSIATNLRRAGGGPLGGLALLDRDYSAWRYRVRAGQQADSPRPGRPR